MAEWRYLGDTFLIRILIYWVGVVFLVILFYFIVVHTGFILWLIADLIAFTIILVLFYLGLSILNLRAYFYSLWDLDEDVVTRRIVMAIRAKGVNVVMTREDGNDVIPLPPLKIIVASGWSRTKVYVGPTKDETRERVEGLKAFVDGALRGIG